MLLYNIVYINPLLRGMKMEKRITFSKKRILWIVITCIMIPILAYCIYFTYLLYFRKSPTIVKTSINSDEESMGQLLDVPNEKESGVENIVLFGVDNRTPTEHGRTDSIIIATIDKNSKAIKLISLMRDLYVDIGNGKSMNRINSAYSIGGPEMAIDTINNNFGLDLKYYAIIDFEAFQKLVDKMGGIDIDVKDYELKEVNKYISEVNGKNATLLKESGFQHLNGQQALSYSRIRKVGNGDYERTERQRLVLKCLMDKAKTVNALRIPDLLTTLVSYVQTNVPLQNIVSLGLSAYKFNNAVQTLRVPVDGYFNSQRVNIGGDMADVLVPDVKANGQFIKEFIYNVKIADSKDVPMYMQNNFHEDDSIAQEYSKPKPNIPNYSRRYVQKNTKDNKTEKKDSKSKPDNAVGNNSDSLNAPGSVIDKGNNNANLQDKPQSDVQDKGKSDVPAENKPAEENKT
ncbi:MAG TPA: hypothetical protein DD426_13585 [Clostridiaceae bacterium]|nr:hypothetical protein [Clostridiaceae bacterium]